MDIITAHQRDTTLKAKQLRRSGFIPCSIFGGDLPESLAIQIEETVVRKLFRQKREGSKLQLNLSGQVILVQIKEMTKNILNNEIDQVSFQALEISQRVNSVIHIMLKNADKLSGTLEKMMLEIPYTSLPVDMIDTITVDLDGIPVGTSLTIQDIPELKSDKIELQVDADSMILRVNDKKRSVTQNEDTE